jgi:transposase
VAKKRLRRYTDEFKRMCVERMKQCNNIGALAEELDIHRRMLYRWRDQLDPAEKSKGPPPPHSREARLRHEVTQLKRALADKTLEVDFFKGALQKVEARRQQQDVTGAQASTTKSGK